VTSRAVEIKGRIVKTESGSVYRLGRISSEYREFLREHVPDWDWRKPVR